MILPVLCLGALSYSLLSALAIPAVPSIQEATGASATEVTWVISGYLLAATAATPVCGRLGDLLGKRRVLLGLLAILALGTAIAAASTSIWPLVAGRVVQGVGGGIYPLCFGIIRDELEASEVPGAIGIISSLMGVGAAVGVVVSGLVLAELPYQWLFVFLLAGVLAALAGTWRYVPDRPAPARAGGRINWAAALLMSAGLTTLLLAISSGPDAGWASARVLGLTALAAALLVAWVRVELATRAPFLDVRMLRARPVLSANAVAVLLGLLMFAGFLLVPQLAQEPVSTGYGFGEDVTVAGLFLLPWSLVQVALAACSGPLERRVGARALLVAAIASCATGGVWFTVSRGAVWEVLVASGLMGGGIGLAFAAMSSLVVAHVRPDQTGAATGMNAVIRLLGGAVGTQLAGSLLAASTLADGSPTAGAYTAGFALTAGAGLLALVAALWMPAPPGAAQPTWRGRASATSNRSATAP